jgi:hypothetical protein
MIRFCEFLIRNELGDERYCGEPALMVDIPGYLFLCKKHYCELSGISDMLRGFHRERVSTKPRIRRICPTCEKVIYIPKYRERSFRNFCSFSCRSRFYYRGSKLESKNMGSRDPG